MERNSILVTDKPKKWILELKVRRSIYLDNFEY